MRRIRLILLVGVLALMMLTLTSVQAMFVRLPGDWVSEITLCQDGYLVHVTGEIFNNGDNTEVFVETTSIPGQTGLVLSVTATTDNFPVDVTKAFFWDSLQTPGTVVTNIQMSRYVNSILIDVVRDADAPDVIGNCMIAATTTGGGIFLGDPQNLVLIPVATGIYDAPNGNLIGTMGDCKTAFVLDTQDGYYEIAVMGGWIRVDATWDVPESYGQPGSELYAGCA